MKRINTVLAAMLLLLTPLAAGTLTLTSPNGGETLTRGAAGQIAWTAVGVSDNVKLILLNEDNSIYGVIVRDLAPGSSPYPWTVGDTEIGRAPVGNYKVRISTMDGGTKDVSNAAFTIAAAADPGTTPGIRDVRLSGASPFPIFDMVTVSWTASGITQAIDMELFRGNGSRVALIYALPAGTTSHGWCAGNFTSGMVGVGDYKIRVSTRDDALSAESAVFTLVAPTCPPSLYLNAPSQYDSWRPGSFHSIHWNIRGWLPNLVQLSLRRAGAPEAEAPVLRLADGVGSHAGEYGEFNWYIPPTLAAGRYFVRARVSASLFADSEVFAISAGGDPGATEGNNIWVAADLALVGVGVEYYNGSIVAWVRNNGPDRLRSHWVQFRVSFPESGSSRNIAKELSIHVGHEEGVPLMELGANSIPGAGLRVIVDIEPSDYNIRDTNRLNQHRDVRIFAH